VKGITLSQMQVTYAERRLLGRADVFYRHYKEETGVYGAITAFQCTEHMPYDQLVLFFEWVDKHLEPGGTALVEFMTTTKSAKCHPFFDKYVFPDGAQFPLDEAIRAAERRKDLLLTSVDDYSLDYYRTIEQWVQRMEARRDDCVRALPADTSAYEKYATFLIYLKWATYLYKTGRSRCYVCTWKKKDRPDVSQYGSTR